MLLFSPAKKVQQAPFCHMCRVHQLEQGLEKLTSDLFHGVNIKYSSPRWEMI